MNAQTKIITSVVATVTATVAVVMVAQYGFAWTSPVSAPPSSTPAISVSGSNVGIGTTAPTAKLEVAASALGSALNNTVEIQHFGGLNSNANSLDIRNIRTSAGTDWNTAGTRIQEKVDATWMGYIQFNGNSNNGGISFGTGLTTTAPGNVGERMRINSAGNVGIGTTSPDSNYKLTTSGGGVKAENSSATQPAGYFSNAGGGPAITAGTGGMTLGGVNRTSWPSATGDNLGNHTATADIGMGNYNIQMNSGYGMFWGGGASASISGMGSNLNFATNSGVGNMTLTSTGSVGIGTASPSGKLHVSSASGYSILENTTAGATGGLQLKNAAVNSYIGTNGSRVYVYAGDATTEDVTILNNGNVGIGTAAPAALLDVKSQLLVRDGTYVEVKPGGNQYGLIVRDTDSNSWGNIDANDGYLALGYGNDNGPLFITGSNVGIGTATPGGTLDVNGRAGAQSFKVASTFVDLVNNAPWYGIGQTNLTLPGAGSTAIQVGGYYGLNFQTAGVQMVLNQAGNVGIGNLNPTQKLDVNGAIRGAEFIDSANSTYLINPEGSSRVRILRVDNSLSPATTMEIGPIIGNGTDQTFNCPAGYILTGMRGGGDGALGGEVEFVYGRCTQLFQ